MPTDGLSDVPAELLETRLRRLGEGIGKVVYASPHWVVKRQRSPSEMLALIVIWRLLRRMERLLPWGSGKRLLERPTMQIRLLRRVLQPLVSLIPLGVWLSTRMGATWRTYRKRDRRGERLAQRYLADGELMPRTIQFAPVWVNVQGWPGWLTVSEATERVEATLLERLQELAQAGRFADVERWLNRLLEVRQAGWRRGLFSTDAHLKNFGVIEDRIVLLDAGGLTQSWSEIESRLAYEEGVTEPHRQLGLGGMLAEQPEMARRFNDSWKNVVRAEVVRQHWPQQV